MRSVKHLITLNARWSIVGGSKVSTKLTVLESLSTVVDQLIVGGVCKHLIAAQGHNVGKSLYEKDLVPEAQRLMAAAKAKNAEIPLPVDVVTGQAFSADTVAETKAVESIKDSDSICVGPKTSEMRQRN